eukprot:351744-Alexandrium_andersonii.AAC.1
MRPVCPGREEMQARSRPLWNWSSPWEANGEAERGRRARSSPEAHVPRPCKAGSLKCQLFKTRAAPT